MLEPFSTVSQGPRDPDFAAGILLELRSISQSLARLADHLAPEPADVVGTPYVAGRLACSTAWVSQLVNDGKIPARCVVEGTGNGKPWKFHRKQIDEWIKSRGPGRALTER